MGMSFASGVTGAVIELTSDYPDGATPFTEVAQLTNTTNATENTMFTKAAGGAGTNHYITSITVDCFKKLSTSNTGKVTLYDDVTAVWGCQLITTTLGEFTFIHVTFPKPIKITANKAAILKILQTTGGGLYCSATMTGYTI